MHSRRSSTARHIAAALAPLLLALTASACEGEEAECARNEDCQEITCPDGSKMRTCSDGECLQGTDCDVESSGGW